MTQHNNCTQAAHKILAIYTGGTIGMQPVAGKTDMAPAPLAKFLSNVPDCSILTGSGDRPRINWVATSELIDSSNVRVSHWQELAAIITSAYVNYDGFVVLHGTDSMAYTAAALSFAFRGLNKPIVLTGAQQPQWVQGSDGMDNINLALQAAMQGTALPEVCIAFGGRVLRGNRAQKVHASARMGFDSPNLSPLMYSGKTGASGAGQRGPKEQFACNPLFSASISSLFYTPGMSLQGCITQLMQEVEGMVLHSLGSGNLPTDATLLKALKQATADGKILLNITQCQQGRVEPTAYATGASLAQCGVLNGGDMTVEAATTKLMWALANFPATERNAMASYLTTNQAGEML